MKKINIISTLVVFVFLVLSSTLIVQCKNNAEKKADTTFQGEENSATWLTVKQMTENVWRIDDHGSDNMYLVTGNDKALLIDTGTGVGDLITTVKSITTLPVTVVNTHGHPDHAAGNFQFDDVYAHPDDFALMQFFTTSAYHQNAIDEALKNNPELANSIIAKAEDYDVVSRVKPVKEGDIFDLGGRSLQVINVPGHTPGSICLVDSANKQLFTGDNSNTLVWLFLEHSLPLEVYLQSLKHLETFSNEYDTMYPGHGDPLDKDFLPDLIACTQSIVDGKCTGEKYDSFAGSAMLCTHNRASVAFNPGNIHVKK